MQKIFQSEKSLHGYMFLLTQVQFKNIFTIELIFYLYIHS